MSHKTQPLYAKIGQVKPPRCAKQPGAWTSLYRRPIMANDSPLSTTSGAANRRRRAERGLPRLTAKEAVAKREYDRRRGRRLRSQFTSQLARIKLGRGCADCGYRDHAAALHFDHLPGTQKLQEVSQMARKPWADVLAEIDKCEVVCANCHALRTAARLDVEAESAEAISGFPNSGNDQAVPTT